jgi:serine/threonine protein kinase
VRAGLTKGSTAPERRVYSPAMASDGKKSGPATEMAGGVGLAGTAPPAAGSSASMPAEQEASLVGEVIDGRYRIIAKLGEGGMGEVYAAEHVHIEKRVAVKLLRPEIVSNKEAVSRFRQEARSASSIGHKNIIAIEDFGSLPDGRIYLCMELLGGAPLNDLIKHPMAVDRLLNIMIQTGHGLGAAHAKGIVHRDMKPENIFVTTGANGEDVPKLLDFGIAKVAGNDGQNNLTRTGTIFGTPFYMAPEQALGQAVDARVDIYAMGVIMYEVFSGSLPFQGESFMGILTQHITTDPEPVAQRAARQGRTLPHGLDEVITRCLQKDPDRRYRSMDELVQALVQVYRGVAGSGMSSYMDAYVPPPTGAINIAGPQSGALPAHGYPSPSGHPSGMAPVASHPHAQAYGQGRPPTGPVPGSGVYPMPQPPGPPLSYTPVPGGSQAMSASDLDAPRKGGKLALIFAVVAILAVAGAVAAFIIVDKSGQEGGDGGDPPKGNGQGGEQGGVVPSTTDAAAVAAVTPDAAPVAVAPPDAMEVAAETPDAATATPDPVTAEPVVVLVNASASGADIYEGGKKIGRSPQMVKVVPGETRSFVLKAKGYKDATVDIDGTREEVAVRMERTSGKADPKPDPKPDPTPDPKPQTAQERLRELCRKNPSDDRCLMLDD